MVTGRASLSAPPVGRWLGSALAGLWLRFRLVLLRLSAGFRLGFGVDFGSIWIWSFSKILLGFELIWLGFGFFWLGFHTFAKSY